MLLNLSNHPILQWSVKQKAEAEKLYGEVIDLAFPFINPNFTEEEVRSLVLEYYDKVVTFFKKRKNLSKANVVLIQGEFVFVFHLVTLLKEANIKCVASTSERDIQQVGRKKIINFNFIQFREY